MINKFKPAFSLAEVMITMVILGIIAMLTIPIFIGNYQDKANKAKLRKSYSVLQNAFEMVNELDNNDYRVWEITNSNLDITTNIVNKLKKHMSLLKDCGHQAGCWTPKMMKKNKKIVNNDISLSTGTSRENYAFVLNDGTSVLFTIWAKHTITDDDVMGIDENLLNSYNPGIYVDINGLRGPNMYGKDIFIFVLTTEGLLPAGVSNNSARCDLPNSSGYDCTAKYIYDEK